MINKLKKMYDEQDKKVHNIRKCLQIEENNLKIIKNTILLVNDVIDDKLSLNIPIFYSNDLKWSERILFALSKLEKATVNMMVDYLMHLDANLTNKKVVKKNITIMASKLKQQHKIQYKKYDKYSYLYHL